MKYLIVIIFLISCKPSYVFNESPCPIFDRPIESKKKPKYKVEKDTKKEKVILNPKFR